MGSSKLSKKNYRKDGKQSRSEWGENVTEAETHFNTTMGSNVVCSF